MKYMDYFAFAMPFFIAAMILELIYQVSHRKKLYQFNDLIGNLSCGIGQQAIDIFLKIFVITGYKYIYDNFRLFTIPVNLLTSLVLFILIDLSYYWFHRFAHRVNIMWGTHIVHHQSEEFNLSVALRQSWFDNVFNWFFYIPLAFFGFNEITFFALFSFNTIYQFIIHTKTIRRLGFLELFMNTPSHHRVHHGQNTEYIDKNYGGVFIIWDRIFGTFENENEEVIYGVTTPVYSTNPVRLNVSYWVSVGRTLGSIKGPGKKIQFLLNPPGDPIEDPSAARSVHRPVPSTPVNCSRPLRSLQAVYISVNLCIIVALLAMLLHFKDEYSHLAKVQTTSFIIISLSMIGEIVDGKRWVRYFEVIRIFVLFYILMLLLKAQLFKFEYICGPICISILLLYYGAFLKRKSHDIC